MSDNVSKEKTENPNNQVSNNSNSHDPNSVVTTSQIDSSVTEINEAQRIKQLKANLQLAKAIINEIKATP